jgi:hypothetical protein
MHRILWITSAKNSGQVPWWPAWRIWLNPPLAAIGGADVAALITYQPDTLKKNFTTM